MHVHSFVAAAGTVFGHFLARLKFVVQQRQKYVWMSKFVKFTEAQLLQIACPTATLRSQVDKTRFKWRSAEISNSLQRAET